jgi:hypothetical protein
LLIQERESNQELKKLLKVEKEKNEKLGQELAESKETNSSLKRSSGALQDSYDVLQKTHKDFEVQFNVLWSSTSKPSNNNEAVTSQVSVETCDEEVAQENDQLKLEVKRLEKILSELVKQAKVRPPQDNHKNMLNKFEKGSNFTKQASNNQGKLNLSRSHNRPLKKKSLNMQEVHT